MAGLCEQSRCGGDCVSEQTAFAAQSLHRNAYLETTESDLQRFRQTQIVAPGNR